MKRMNMAKKKSKSPFPEEVYESIDLDSLVTYAVWSTEQKGEACTFERLVEECFTLFPKKFSLFGYPHWPDSARVNKSWLRCRTDKGLIKGTVKTGFRLTPLGEKSVLLTVKALEGAVTLPKRKPTQRSRSIGEAMLARVHNHHLFRRYLQDGDDFTVSRDELRHLLMTTGMARNDVVLANLEKLTAAAEKADDQRVLDFIAACSTVLGNTIQSKRGTMNET